MNTLYSFYKTLITGILLIPTLLFSQYVVDFEDATKVAYAAGTVNLNGLDWNMAEVLIGTSASDWKIGLNSARLRGYGTSVLEMTQNKSNGIGTISFSYQRYGTDTQVDWKVEYSIDNGSNWIQIGSDFTASALSEVQTFSQLVNVDGNVRVRIKRATETGVDNRRLNVDNITISDYNATPITDTLVAFTSASATIVDNVGTYNLNVSLNAPFTGANKTVDVVLSAGDGNIVNNFTSQTLTFTAGGSLSQSVALTISNGLVSGSEVLTFELQNIGAGLVLGTNNEFTLTVIEPLSLPNYTIATLRGANANGGPDSLGVVCQVSGKVLGVNFGTGLQLNFFINDGSAGMGVFAPAAANNFGYTVQEGDSISVQGRVSTFRGLAQMDSLISITLLGTATVPAPQVVSSLGENTEGELVKLENVTVVTQSSWGTNAAGGYDVKVVNASNDTLLIRVDADTELFGTALPGCVLDVTGIGTQFAPTSVAPFVGGYRIQPRLNSDINVIEACVVPTIPTYPIATVRGNNTGGVPDLLNEVCRVRGTVYGINLRTDGGLDFTIHDNTAGIGVFVPAASNSFGYTVAEGDSVEIVGEVRHFNGLGQMSFVQSITVLGQGTLRTPRVVTVLDESTESDLVKLLNVTKPASSTWPNATTAANITLNSPAGQFTARILPVTNIVNDIPAPTSAFNLIGIGGQFDNSAPYTTGYQLVPRRAQDFEAITSIGNTLQLAQFNAYPNPTSNVVTLSFENKQNEVMLIDIYDVAGKLIKTLATNISAGANNIEINLSNVEIGYYFVSLQTTEGVYTTKILKK